MALIEQARHYSPPSEPIAVIVTNGLPLVGVVALGWDITALVFLYWFELGIIPFWALVRSLFAGRPPESDSDPLIADALVSKRTTNPIPFTDLVVGFPRLQAREEVNLRRERCTRRLRRPLRDP